MLQQFLTTLSWLGGWLCFFAGLLKLFRAHQKKADPTFPARKKEAFRYLAVGILLLGFLLYQIAYDGVFMRHPSPALPKEGAIAPSFTLQNQEGKPIALESFRGKWVVLYFYPMDFTSGCSLEAHNFQEDLPKYVAKNATIVGVSTDDPATHKSFCAKEGLDFALLADTEHKAITLYGSKMGFSGATVAARNTFLIDPQGVIRKVYVDVSPAKHSAEVLADLEKLAKP